MGPSQLPPLEGGVFSTYSMGSVRKSEQHCASGVNADVRGRSLGRGGLGDAEERAEVGRRGPAHSPVALTSPASESKHQGHVAQLTPTKCAPLPTPSVSSLCGSSPAISQERGRKDRQGESPKRS